VTTTDATLRALANQRMVKPVISDSERVIFALPRGTGEVRLLSRAQSPTEARPWLEDRRQLGVRVKRIVLRGGDDVREVPLDHPDLTGGWWAVERDGQIMSRWTRWRGVAAPARRAYRHAGDPLAARPTSWTLRPRTEPSARCRRGH
jgi:hypothetical protein